MMGSTADANTSRYHAKYGSGYMPGIHASGKGVNKSNVVGSRRLSSEPTSGLDMARERNGIAYTKTFEVRHGDNDEEQLVKMDDLNDKGLKTRSISSSDVSASGVIGPLPIQHQPPR